MLRLNLGGLRSGKQPLKPRVQLLERGLQRGDFSLWLLPVRREDAGEYRASVSLRDRDRDRHRALACRLRLRVGQASRRWGRDGGGLELLRMHPRERGGGEEGGEGRRQKAGCTAPLEKRGESGEMVSPQ